MCSLPGLQDSLQTGDDRTSHCCAGSDGTTGMRHRLNVVKKVIVKKILNHF